MFRRILILFLALFLTSGTRVASTETQYFLPIIVSEDLCGAFHWERIPLTGSSTAEGYARIAYKYFFRYGIYGVPENVQVLDITFEDGLLTVDVSEDIVLYGGGSAFEMALVAQLTEIAGVVPGVDRLTLLIEGKEQPLAQGTKLVSFGVPP